MDHVLVTQDHFFAITGYFIDILLLRDCSGDKLKIQLKKQGVERMRDNRRPVPRWPRMAAASWLVSAGPGR